jgi:hypothetical protein
VRVAGARGNAIPTARWACVSKSLVVQQAPGYDQRVRERSYALEKLYDDQLPDLVVDTIPALLAWLPASEGKEEPAAAYRVRLGRRSRRIVEEVLALSWNAAALVARDPGMVARTRRMREGMSAQREHVTELAAYALALVGISVWMPGRRAVAWSKRTRPDLLLDETPGSLRGVEVAGRTSGGLGALRVVLEGSKKKRGKRAELLELPDVVEAHVSLWCGRPAVAMIEQVKP